MPPRIPGPVSWTLYQASIYIPMFILLAFPKEDIEIILDFYGNHCLDYYGSFKVFIVSSSLYHVLINVLDIIYVSVMDFDLETVDWIPESIKNQKMGRKI